MDLLEWLDLGTSVTYILFALLTAVRSFKTLRTPYGLSLAACCAAVSNVIFSLATHDSGWLVMASVFCFVSSLYVFYLSE